MANSNEADKNSFLYPRSRYYGQVKPEKLVLLLVICQLVPRAIVIVKTSLPKLRHSEYLMPSQAIHTGLMEIKMV